MIWGRMAMAELGKLAFVERRSYLGAYIELLEEKLPGSLVKWMSENQHFYKMVIIFQQDNAPAMPQARSNNTSRMLRLMSWTDMLTLRTSIQLGTSGHGLKGS